jgi:hypothetical protein
MCLMYVSHVLCVSQAEDAGGVWELVMQLTKDADPAVRGEVSPLIHP